MPLPIETIEIYARIPSPPLDHGWLDGPEGIAQANDGSLYVGSGDGWIYRVPGQDQVEPFAKTEGRPLGIALDRSGSLFVCDMKVGAVYRISLQAQISIWAAGTDSRRMQTPNFAVFDERGWLYVSDSGSSTLTGPKPDGAIFRISPAGDCELFADGLYLANGLAMRQGESALYVIQTTEDNVLRLEIRDDGSLGSISVFAQNLQTIPDGMAFAENGDLFVIASGTDTIYRVTPMGQIELWVQDPDAERLRAPANCAFGGTNLDQLFITNLVSGHISQIKGVAKGQLLYHQMDRASSAVRGGQET